MKHFRKQIISVMLVAVIVLAGIPTQTKAASKGYVFAYKGVSATMNGKAAALLKKAGKPISKKRSKSCAYNGLDGTYVYKDFIVTTYSNSVKGAEYINSITLRTSKVATKEGIKIGSSYNSVVKKYGKGKDNFGVYVYTKGKSKLQFEITNNKVKKITYLTK
jgi:hypothetical protein